MSTISGYGQYNVNSYYSGSQSTSVQPQQQPPQTDFSQMLSSGIDSRSGASGAGMSDATSGASSSMQSSSSFQASLDKMMFMASTQNLGQSGQSGTGGFMSDLQSLSSALNSGDLTAAKDAFSKIESHMPQNGQNAATATTSTSQADTSGSATASTQDQRAKDFAALQSALDSGNTNAAKDALATIMQDAKQSKGHGHHHGGHHHGGGLNALMDAQNTSQSTGAQDLASILLQQSSTVSQGGSQSSTSQNNLANILLQQQLGAYSSIQSATA